jgi:hypothetical protein
VTGSVKTPLKTIAAPYGREIRLEESAYENRMKLMKATIRDAVRYTILELEAATVLEWSRAMQDWGQAIRESASG